MYVNCFHEWRTFKLNVKKCYFDADGSRNKFLRRGGKINYTLSKALQAYSCFFCCFSAQEHNKEELEPVTKSWQPVQLTQKGLTHLLTSGMLSRSKRAFISERAAAE
jgi:hypothetical protein